METKIEIEIIIKEEIENKILENNNLYNMLKELHNNEALIFIVGGFVRDILLNRYPYDIDIELFNIEVEDAVKIIEKYYNIIAFKKYGVYKINNDLNISFSFPRIDRKQENDYYNLDIIIDPKLSLNDASKRRDLTINSIYYDIFNNKLYDPYNGITDINNKILRKINNKFYDDPMRIMRIIRFTSELGFDIDEETIKSIQFDGKINKNKFIDEMSKFYNGKYIMEAIKYLSLIISDMNAKDIIKQINIIQNLDISKEEKAIIFGEYIYKIFNNNI